MALNPRLVSISGPLQGKTILLEQEVVSIGRFTDNTVQVLESGVSRHHCDIHLEDGKWVIRDRDSRHGTFVNSVPVRQRVLAHSDLVSIGGSAFLVLFDDSASDLSDPSGADELVFGSTVQLRSEDSLYLDRRKVRAVLPEGDGIAGALATLLELAAAMHAPRSPDELARRLLELTLEALPAERGAVVLVEAGGDLRRSAFARRSGDAEPFTPSRTVTERALEDRVGLLTNDVTARPDVGHAESVAEAEVSSILCVPLLGREHPLGVLYFDSSAAVFTESHSELVTAAGRIASLALESAGYLEWLRGENRRLRAEYLEHDIVGESAVIRRVLELIERLAPTDSTVLIRGESGTGKELAAQAVCRSSPRADGPFVAVNCATLSEALLESELFGHEKGAFTGAVATKIGKIEAADGGTLFLDEVGELPPAVQAKLLRVLQEREFERLGGRRPIRVDVRVIAATNRDLEEAIRERTFRQDLFYRLDVISFTMPPLRDRRDDIPLLARHFARLHGERSTRRVAGISPEAGAILRAYDWPGNVRQLANVIERAVVLGLGELIRPEDLPDEVVEGAGPATSDYQAALVAFKKKLVADAFRKTGGDHVGAAALLGLHVNSLHRLIRNLGIKAALGQER